MGSITDWDDAYANAKYIPDADDFPPRWQQAAQAFRAAHPNAEIDLAYGSDPRQQLDLFHPPLSPVGLAVFVHGGYWMKLDKSYWSHLAAGALSRGWSVALPSYRLAPQVPIEMIVADAARAVTLAANRITGPIRLSGHSAGGHLVSMLATQGGGLDTSVADRIERVFPISGLHDLRPLLKTQMNQTLGVTQDSAIAQSPAFRDPHGHIELAACVGADERPEFLRQTDLIVDAWQDKCARATCLVEERKHHFDVIDSLQDPDSRLTKQFLGDG
jgi:hypothetical protein